nr:immunoglobulin heavy chain junction region [Macaca mulatta]MOX58639.1 immunoglobulin heavy chain junction region [Macaca mulatta]MOX60908.1 immunoglobulin heavy chain junction region [Macaca mulatta]MOX61116.1 immunoglobulin heavy chain junction region [Macaca mulatta]MOX61215.1 immunoglobulin heavy chain junction region [Macaca mulatta]
CVAGRRHVDLDYW